MERFVPFLHMLDDLVARRCSHWGERWASACGVERRGRGRGADLLRMRPGSGWGLEEVVVVEEGRDRAWVLVGWCEVDLAGAVGGLV